MVRVIVYGPIVCGKCNGTIRLLTSAGIPAEKAVIDDPMSEIVLASKSALLAERRREEGLPEVNLTIDEIAAHSFQAPFVWIEEDGKSRFGWADLRPDKIKDLAEEYVTVNA